MDTTVHVQHDYSNVGRFQYFLVDEEPSSELFHVQLPNGKFLVKTNRGWSKYSINNVDWQSFLRVVAFDWLGYSVELVEQQQPWLTLDTSQEPKQLYNCYGECVEGHNTIEQLEWTLAVCELGPLPDEPTLYDLCVHVDRTVGFTLAPFLINPLTKVYKDLLKAHRALYQRGLKPQFVSAVTPSVFDVMLYYRLWKYVVA